MTTANPIIEVYLDSCIALASSIVFKLSDVATAINNALIAEEGLGAVDETNPLSWKYYLNISGEYHPSDEIMTIRSLDTQAQIDFTKSNLASATQPLTKAAYTYNSNYYKDLLARYPNQVDLIRGILMPCDIQTAIEAEEATILAYDSTLVEQTEPSLMLELQGRLSANYMRWGMRSFAITNNLYTPIQIARIYGWMTAQIWSIRQSLSLTSEVHSFHIQQRLASTLGLDEHMRDLTRAQQLYMYSQLPYLINQVGKSSTLKGLLENLVDADDFDIYSVTARHFTGQQISGRRVNSLTPQLVYTKTNVLTGDTKPSWYTQDYVFSMMASSAKSTDEYQQTHAAAIRQAMIQSPSSVVKTKLMTVEPTRFIDNSSYPLQDVLMAHWLVWSQSGRFACDVSFTPVNKSTAITTTVKKASTLFLYCISRMRGLNPVYKQRYIISDIFSAAPDMFGNVSSKVALSRFSRDDIAELRNFFPRLKTWYVDVADFSESCSAIHQGQLRADTYLMRFTEYDRQMYGKNTMRSLFSTSSISPDPTAIYSELLEELGIDISNYTPSDFYTLANEIFVKCTNYSVDETGLSLQEKADRLVRLLAKLTSYSVLFATDANFATSRRVNAEYARSLWQSGSTTARFDQGNGKFALQPQPLKTTYGVYATSVAQDPILVTPVVTTILSHDFANVPSGTLMRNVPAEVGGPGNLWKDMFFRHYGAAHPEWLDGSYTGTGLGLQNNDYVGYEDNTIRNFGTKVSGNFKITTKVIITEANGNAGEYRFTVTALMRDSGDAYTYNSWGGDCVAASLWLWKNDATSPYWFDMELRVRMGGNRDADYIEIPLDASYAYTMAQGEHTLTLQRNGDVFSFYWDDGAVVSADFNMTTHAPVSDYLDGTPTEDEVGVSVDRLWWLDDALLKSIVVEQLPDSVVIAANDTFATGIGSALAGRTVPDSTAIWKNLSPAADTMSGMTIMSSGVVRDYPLTAPTGPHILANARVQAEYDVEVIMDIVNPGSLGSITIDFFTDLRLLTNTALDDPHDYDRDGRQITLGSTSAGSSAEFKLMQSDGLPTTAGADGSTYLLTTGQHTFKLKGRRGQVILDCDNGAYVSTFNKSDHPTMNVAYGDNVGYEGGGWPGISWMCSADVSVAMRSFKVVRIYSKDS